MSRWEENEGIRPGITLLWQSAQESLPVSKTPFVGTYAASGILAHHAEYWRVGPVSLQGRPWLELGVYWYVLIDHPRTCLLQN
jgi:hypothetical protein